VARTKGAVGKKKNDIKLVVGIGVPPMMPKDMEKGKAKAAKPKGKTTTQGAKAMNKMPNSMRSGMKPKM
jgi:hypothetical protein